MNVSYKPKYMWDFIEWSKCNAKCDGGTMVINVTTLNARALDANATAFIM